MLATTYSAIIATIILTIGFAIKLLGSKKQKKLTDWAITQRSVPQSAVVEEHGRLDQEACTIDLHDDSVSYSLQAANAKARGSMAQKYLNLVVMVAVSRLIERLKTAQLQKEAADLFKKLKK